MTRPFFAALGLALVIGPGLGAQDISVGVGSFPRTEEPDSGISVAPPAPPGTESAGRNILANDPVAIQQAMMEEGYLAKLETRDDGSVVITGRVSKTNFWVYFKNCDDDNTNCRAIQFHSGYIVDNPPSYEQINDFNSRFRFIRAWLTEEMYPRMQMDILMREDGIGRENFGHYLRAWTDLIGVWEEFLKI